MNKKVYVVNEMLIMIMRSEASLQHDLVLQEDADGSCYINGWIESYGIPEGEDMWDYRNLCWQVDEYTTARYTVHMNDVESEEDHQDRLIQEEAAADYWIGRWKAGDFDYLPD